MKLFFKNEGEIKIFSGKQEIKELSLEKVPCKKCLKKFFKKGKMMLVRKLDPHKGIKSKEI